MITPPRKVTRGRGGGKKRREGERERTSGREGRGDKGRERKDLDLCQV